MISISSSESFLVLACKYDANNKKWQSFGPNSWTLSLCFILLPLLFEADGVESEALAQRLIRNQDGAVATLKMNVLQR